MIVGAASDRAMNHQPPRLDFLHSLPPLFVAIAFIAAVSLLREPKRRQFSALMIAGAGATYFGAGFGFWEVAFWALMTWLAFRALDDYRYAGVGWLLHVGWDVLHHLYGHPILPFLPLSSEGCAICDSVLAIWYFLAAPSLYRPIRLAGVTERGT
jgi:Family of unknown function (DUF6010)